MSDKKQIKRETIDFDKEDIKEQNVSNLQEQINQL